VSGPAQVDSVNVGRPKLLLINGQPNKTGIDKQPIDGPVELRDDAVAGDAVVDRDDCVRSEPFRVQGRCEQRRHVSPLRDGGGRFP